MATFTENITVEGQTLLAKSLSGEQITFTKIVLGDGNVTMSEMANIRDVVSPKVTLEIQSVLKDASSNVTVTSIFDNASLKEGFYYREKGLYATDGTTEILFLYGNNGTLAEWISPGGNQVVEKKIISVLTFSESQDINVTLQNGVYVTSEELEAHDNSDTAHGKLREWVKSLFSSISLTWDKITGKPSTFPPAEHSHDYIPITASCNREWHYAVKDECQYAIVHGDLENCYVRKISDFKVADAQTVKTRDVCEEIDNLKTISVNGKALIAAAINGIKGTSLTAATTYADMAYYIKSIPFAVSSISLHSIQSNGLSASDAATHNNKMIILEFIEWTSGSEAGATITVPDATSEKPVYVIRMLQGANNGSSLGSAGSECYMNGYSVTQIATSTTQRFWSQFTCGSIIIINPYSHPITVATSTGCHRGLVN